LPDPANRTLTTRSIGSILAVSTAETAINAGVTAIGVIQMLSYHIENWTSTGWP